MGDRKLTKKLQEISIRGRMAIAMTCVENVLPDLPTLSNSGQDLLDQIMEDLWRFTYSDDLGKWDTINCEYGPCYLTGKLGSGEKWTEKELRLKALYDSLPEFFVEMVDEVVDLGRSYIGSSVGIFSQPTLLRLTTILGIMEKNNYPLPDISKFQKYRFKEYGGWGVKIPSRSTPDF